jgi:DNA-nicking Smr family endonuclease
MTDSHDLSEDEIFRAAMEGVRPLVDDRAQPAVSPPKPVPRQAMLDELAVREALLSDHYDPEALDCGEELSYAKPGLQNRVLRKLRRGQFSVASELDLHGMTVPMAREALSEFLVRCRLRDHRCVRIIHGKGRRSSNAGPVLKVKVDRWLRQRDEVIAFCTARPMDGGSGAVYVLFKY